MQTIKMVGVRFKDLSKQVLRVSEPTRPMKSQGLLESPCQVGKTPTVIPKVHIRLGRYDCTLFLHIKKRSQFPPDRREHRVPIVPLRLPEQAHRRIPRAVVTIEHPAPVRHMPESKPRRSTERPRQMCDRRVGGDDQVEALHRGGGVDEGVRTAVEIIPERFDLTTRWQTSDLIQSVVLLQADQPNSGQAG